jgi:predicted AAA+ superfamily ATPase
MIIRSLYPDLLHHIPAKECTILIGARQTGKSTLLKQVQDALLKKGETVVLLNLERKDILLELNQSPENVLRYFPAKGTRNYLLVDEVQYLQDPTNFLKLLYDEHAPNLKIIATGSSAFYIDRNFKDSLAGRKKIFELPTLDFEEFLSFRNQEALLAEYQSLKNGTKQKSTSEQQLWTALDEYINYGGYPAIVLENKVANKIERLQEIRDSFVKRDILEAGITDETKFFRLLILLASQIGSLVNINELANTLGLTHPATENYLYVLRKCFYIELVKPFFSNVRKELVKMPKVYFNDLGLRNVLVNYFSPIEQRADKGALLENYVYRSLADKLDNDKIKFWRTADGNEVDFVLEESNKQGRAIEVKFNLPAGQTGEANPKKYKKFTELYPNYPIQFFSWRGERLFV